MGIFPKWLSEFPKAYFATFKQAAKENWPEFKKEVGLGAKAVGETASSIVEGVVKPILSGVRSALTPTVIWLVIIGIVSLLLYTYFKKAVRI